MKRFGWIGTVSLFCWFGIQTAGAHDCDHHGHYYQDDCHGYDRVYDHSYSSPSGTADLRTLEGRIGEVVYLPGPTPDSGMVEIRVVSGNQTTLVRLAPSGFLKQSGMTLREGESVTVKGFSVAGMEGDFVVATEIHEGGRVLNLRDARGRSAW